MDDILFRLVRATCASCSCCTKTNVPSYHQETCLYRVLSDAMDEIESLRKFAGKTSYQHDEEAHF
jgi:transcription elongation factor Elf1